MVFICQFFYFVKDVLRHHEQQNTILQIPKTKTNKKHTHTHTQLTQE
jgi:hypothetical protein